MCSFGSYMSTLTAMFSPKARIGYLSPLAFRALDYMNHRYSHEVRYKISQYVWAALPKPTHPDGISIAAARNDKLDISNIAGLVDEKYRPEETLCISAVDQLACDLQMLGRNWQVFYDHCADLLRYVSRSSLSGPERSQAAERLRRDRRSTATIDMVDNDENR